MGESNPNTSAPSLRLARRTIAVLVSFYILILAIRVSASCIRRYHDAFGMYHDDAIYMVTAKALADGEGYRIMSLPGQPLETKYPIGYPYLLSLAWKLSPQFPGNLWAIEILQVAAGIGSLLLAGIYLVVTRKVTPLLGSAIFCASVLNFHFLDFSPMVMSDLPCALLSIAGIWFAERLSKKPFTTRSAIALGLLMASAGLVRMLGVILPVSVTIFLALKKRWQLLLTSAGTALVILVPYILWQTTQQSHADPYLSYYTNYVGHTAGTLPKDLWSGGFSDFQWWIHLQTETAFPFFSQIPYRSLSPVVFIFVYSLLFPLLAGISLLGNIVWLRRISLPAIYGTVLYWAMIFWPAKIEWRHIVPFLPLFYYFLFLGFRWLGKKLKPVLRRRVPYLGICQTAAVAMALYLVAAGAFETSQRAGTYGDIIASHNPLLAPAAESAEYREACAWIREHTRSSDVFVCNNDPLLYLYTGRKALSPSRYEITRFMSGQLVEPASMTEAIKFAGANYVMSEPSYRAMGLIWAEAGQSLLRLLADKPGCLTPVYKSSHGLIYIFAVDRSKL